MGRKNQNTDTLSHPPPADDRLDSWKEIASYLRREVRTVQRWEQNESLPVHRHVHNKQPTVYAYRSELDAWWNNRRPKLEAEEAQTKETKRKVWRRLAAALAGVALVAAAAGLGWWWARRPALPFAERDWVLIADFENHTGNPLFDGTLEHALERELSNSRYVNVVPRIRVADTLALMGKPADNPLDPNLAHEVALRDGGIRAILAGRVERLGPRLVLSTRVINPVDGVTVASLSEEAGEDEELGLIVHRLAQRMRTLLGERLPRLRHNRRPLERVTTRSLRALRLFSQGNLFKEQHRDKEAEPLLREAIREDPEFASAHMWLAWIAWRKKGGSQEAIRLAKRALELSHLASERERLFNQASYYVFTEDYERAYAMTNALLRLYPDDYWATLTMTWLPLRVGRPVEIAQHKFSLARLRPNDTRAIQAALEAVLDESYDLEAARPYMERLRALAQLEESPVDQPRRARLAMRAEFLPVPVAWVEGDIEKAWREFQRLRKGFDAASHRFSNAYAAELARSYLRFGRLKEGEKMCQDIESKAYRHVCLHDAAYWRGDREAVREHWRLGVRALGWWDTLSLAYLGLAEEALEEIADLEKRNVVPGWNESARALLRLREGREGAAVELEEAMKQLRPHNFLSSLFAAQALAEYYEQKGATEKAIALLEEADALLKERRWLALYDAQRWLSRRALLAKLYRRSGRLREAQATEQEVRRRLIYADPDHPILLSLRHEQATQVQARRQ